ncbi:hypothetical protein [Thioclava sp. GXIMD2076]|uniref:Uncharacterized protein n=1 Tax=Thioclava kandeliae TaxID=3070818 RepID=A0ABV1SF38_9RHOB
MTYRFEIPHVAPRPDSLVGGIDQPGFGQRTRLDRLRSSEIQTRSVSAVIHAETIRAKVMRDTVAVQERAVSMWSNHLSRLQLRRDHTRSPHICPILEREIQTISARLEKAIMRLELARSAIDAHGPDIAARISHWQALRTRD